MTEPWLQPDVLTFSLAVFGGAALGLVGLLAGHRRVGRLLMLALAGLMAGVAGWRASRGESVGAWLPVAVLAALSLGFWARHAPRLARVRGTVASLAADRRLQALAVLAAVPLLAWVWTHQFDIDAEEPLVPPAGVANPPTAIDTSIRAVTDKGRPIRLGKATAGPEYQANVPAEDARVTTAYTGRVIQTAPPDAASNCHGWTFTGGSHWVRCEDVDMILEDNDYEVVSTPEPDDIIIYRDEAGTAIHSGVVRCVTKDGLVLIESKWGPLGRYLHTPEGQCYGSSYTYYRTTRLTHLLRGLPGTTGDDLPSPSVPVRRAASAGSAAAGRTGRPSGRGA